MSQNKLKHRVIFCSSEDAGYSAKELNNSSADSKGWLSARFPEFPQEIGFELLGGNPQERNLQLTQVQILSHQSKIATKIEIFVGVGNDYTLFALSDGIVEFKKGKNDKSTVSVLPVEVVA